MMQRLVPLAVVIIATLTVSGGAAQERRPPGIEITGIAVNGEGAPLTGKAIWFLPWDSERGSARVWWQAARPINPRGVADQEGRFRMLVTPSFGTPGTRFALGIDIIQFDGGDVARRAGTPAIFTLAEGSEPMDVGRIVIIRQKR